MRWGVLASRTLEWWCCCAQGAGLFLFSHSSPPQTPDPELFPTWANQLRFHAWRVLFRPGPRATQEQRGKPGDPGPAADGGQGALRGAEGGPPRTPLPAPMLRGASES